MFIEILRFALVRHIRALSTRIYLLVFTAFGLLWMAAAGGALPNASVSFGGDKVFLNGPFVLFESISVMSYIGLLVISAIAGRAAYQDFEDRTHSFFFTSPISKRDYLAGRYLAAVLISIVIFAVAAFGLWLATLLPNVDQQRFEQNHFVWYVQPYLITVIPNVVVMSALFFSLAALSRRILPVYMSSVILLTGYLAAGDLTRNLQNRFLAAMIDPFGDEAADRVTEYWTIAEKNSQMVWLHGALLWNRVLWLSVAAAVLAFTYYRFRFAYANPIRSSWFSRRKTIEPAPAALPFSGPIRRVFSAGASWGALLRLSWLGFVETVKNVYFAVILLAGIIFMAVSAHELGDLYGTPTYPVTYQVLDMAGGTFFLFVLIITTYYSGELVWRERDARAHELFDSLPLPTWTQFLAKFLSLFYVQVLLSVVVMLTGMAIQLCKGYTHLEPDVYLKILGIRLLDYTLLSALAITVQTVVNNKYLGHGVMVLYYLATIFFGQFGLEHNLYVYGDHPGFTYSDMNGFGHQLRGLFWFDAYWSVLAVLFLLASYLLWVRGLSTNARARLSIVRARFGRVQRTLAAAGALLLIALGGFIIYNTNYLHIFRTRTENEKLAVRYEHEYRKYLKSPQPRITSVTYHADLYPERLAIHFYGKYAFTNKASQPIDRVLVSIPEEAVIHRVEFSVPSHVETKDRPVDLFIYRFDPPLAPGESGEFRFDLEYAQHGFENGEAPTGIVYNGSFMNSDSLPQFGYQEGQELSSDKIRRKYKLAPKPRMYDLNDTAARRNTYISQDADWLTFDATVSTSPDQIAIAPGELVREWSEGGRRYFHYQTRGKVLNFSSVLSARYKVIRDRWNDVALEIYYQPGHQYNLAKMMKGMKKALAYCTANFSPYQNKTVRIIEFPRYQSFAQSFPASIPFSESIGFIARVNSSNEEDVDYPFYVTAHEVAHQWWAHQVVGGNVQGATLMSESLAQYTALMVMKHEYGPEHMRRFLKYEMDHYLSGRSGEPEKELPLVRGENQGYIHYNKASVVFYALQDYAGEDNINRALREYLQAVAYQDPPYTYSPELVARLRAVMPQPYLYVIGDMLETITLYENRAVSATAKKLPDGSFSVDLKVKARKVTAGELGEEKDLPLADWIDIAVLDDKGLPLYLERKLVDKGEMEFHVTVKGIPAKAGIDPWNKLVDRDPNDNTVKVSLGS